MLIENEIQSLNTRLTNSLFDENNQISDDITDYLASKSKRIRPSLIFLIAKAMDINISEKVYNLAVSVELIHNSTLVHDDILDNAKKRRGVEICAPYFEFKVSTPVISISLMSIWIESLPAV